MPLPLVPPTMIERKFSCGSPSRRSSARGAGKVVVQGGRPEGAPAPSRAGCRGTSSLRGIPSSVRSAAVARHLWAASAGPGGSRGSPGPEFHHVPGGAGISASRGCSLWRTVYRIRAPAAARFRGGLDPAQKMIAGMTFRQERHHPVVGSGRVSSTVPLPSKPPSILFGRPAPARSSMGLWGRPVRVSRGGDPQWEREKVTKKSQASRD